MAGLEGQSLNRYQLSRLAGRGGMADVYEAFDPKFERIVAIKVFKREDEDMLRRFIREARLMASLSNEHLVPIYDTGSSQVDNVTWYYIVMPFMEGGTLRARIRRAPLTLAEACRCLREIADGLDYIHRQGIIHRDIKASNVLLDTEGRCYLSDFGIARTTTDATQLTSTGNVLGTVEYVAPELFEGDNKANELSDLYSLGVLLFEMVTGRLPFLSENQIAVVTMHMNKQPPSPRSISQQISLPAERVILRALEKKPENRYATATELANTFCRAINDRNAPLEAAFVPPVTQSGAGYPPQQQGKLILGPPPEPQPLSSRADYGQAYANLSDVAELPTKRSTTGRRQASPVRQREIVVAILAVLTVLIIAGSLVFAYVQRNGTGTQNSSTPTSVAQNTATQNTITPTASPNQTATAQANATATVQAQAHATATAIVGATATVVARASATAGVLQTATAGSPAYQDALNDPTNSATQAANWDNNSHCAIATDGYHVTQAVNPIGLHGCREAANSYQNFALTVKVKIISGHSGGVFLRLHTDAFNVYSGYLLELDSAGNYKISNFSGGAPVAIQDWTNTSALKKGYNVKNTVQIVARGSSLSFYANGTYLTTVTDASYSDGSVGFLASVTDTDTEVAYSDLNIYPLSA